MSEVRFENPDSPELVRASQLARANFRFMWREMDWDSRRMIPGLDSAAVKVPLSESMDENGNQINVEQVWLGEIDFDGRLIYGTILNEPIGLTQLVQGDTVAVPFTDLSDWMFAVEGKAYGGFTVQYFRSQMSEVEREEHDSMWELEFPPPNSVEVIPIELWESSLSVEGKSFDELATIAHPLESESLESLEEFLKQRPDAVHLQGPKGWTIFHSQVAIGAAKVVEMMLKYGADPNTQTESGLNSVELARLLNWPEVERVLTRATKR